MANDIPKGIIMVSSAPRKLGFPIEAKYLPEIMDPWFQFTKSWPKNWAMEYIVISIPEVKTVYATALICLSLFMFCEAIK